MGHDDEADNYVITSQVKYMLIFYILIAIFALLSHVKVVQYF